MAGLWLEDAPACPRTEDFHLDSELGLDLVEGCRLVCSKSWPLSSGSQVDLSQAVNMGTYSGLDSQQSIIQSLLNPSAMKRGGKNWSTTLRYIGLDPAKAEQDINAPDVSSSSKFARPLPPITTPRHKWSWLWGERVLLARYSSLSQQYQLRGSWRVRKLNVSAAWFTSQPLAALRRWLPLAPLPAASEDLGIIRVDRETPTSHCGVKLSMQPGTPVIGLSYSGCSVWRRLWGGCDWSYFPLSGALLTTYALKRQVNDLLTLTTSLSTEPNFDKPVEEGLQERVFHHHTSLLYKVLPNLNVVASSRLKFGPPDAEEQPKEPTLDSHEYLRKYLPAKVLFRSALFTGGYELTLAKARLLAEVNSQLQVKSVVHTADGFVYSGQIDIPNENYQFGFGYELSA